MENKRSGRDNKTTKKIKIGPLLAKFLVLAAFLTLFALIYFNYDQLTPENISNFLQDTFVFGSNQDDFPVSLQRSIVRKEIRLGSSLAFVNDTALYVYNSAGHEMFSNQHGFSNPEVSAAGSNLLVYDRGGKNYLIAGKSEVKQRRSYDDIIYSAAMGQNGRYVIAGESKNYASRMTVYSAAQEVEYERFFSDGKVAFLDISDNGKYVAAACVSVVNAQISTTLYLFSIYQQDPIFQQQYPGMMPFGLFMNTNNSLVLVGSSGVVYSDSAGKQPQTFEYGGYTLENFDSDSAGITALLLQSATGNGDSAVLAVDSAGKRYDYTAQGQEILDISCKDKQIAVLLKDKAILYNLGFQSVFQADNQFQYGKITYAGKNIYVTDSSQIRRYEVD